MIQITPDSTLQRSNDILASDMGDELVMMSMENNAYYGLNLVGKEIWHLLEKDQTPESICKVLRERFDVSNEQCLNDVTLLLVKLLDAKLISIA